MRLGAVFFVMVLMIVAPAIYVGSYLLLLQREEVRAHTDQGCMTWYAHTYRIQSPLVEMIYAPAQKIDRWCRPGYWAI